jgi:hypothetical protein
MQQNMAKKESGLQRIDKKIIEDIKKTQEELKKKLNIDISFPQASKSWYEEMKMKLNKKNGGIKF